MMFTARPRPGRKDHDIWYRGPVASPADVRDVLAAIPIVGRGELESEPRSA